MPTWGFVTPRANDVQTSAECIAVFLPGWKAVGHIS